jgi:methionyl aminopeptidase
MPKIKSEKDLYVLQTSGKILKAVLDAVSDAAVPGVKLAFLDRLAFDLISSYEARPSFLGYRPEGAKKAYPASICASLGGVVVHGIPDLRVLEEGDVLKIDIGVDYKGYFTDSARTVVMGGNNPLAWKNSSERPRKPCMPALRRSGRAAVSVTSATPSHPSPKNTA